MFWKWLDRLTTMAFLLLAVVLTVQISSDRYSNNKVEAFSLEVQAMTLELKGVMDNNIRYVEGRVNTLAQSQDQYQVSTSNRLQILENRVQMWAERRKESTRITNSNTAIANGSTEPSKKEQ